MMKLGRDTGSLSNHVLSIAVKGQPEPKVGMGATMLCWSDRHAGTIVEVQTVGGATIITVQEDTAKRLDKNGLSESQDYAFEPNPNGARYWFRRTPEGFWQEVRLNAATKRWNKTGGPGLRIGDRSEYRDPSF